MDSKKISLTLATIMAVVSIGCGSTTTAETAESKTAKENTAAVSEAQEETITDAPAPSGEKLHVVPQEVQVSGEFTEDGIYPAEFTVGSLKEDEKGMSLTLDIFTLDTYDIVDMAMLKAGDDILVDGKVVPVKEVERPSGAVIINGGLDEGGYEFHPVDESNCYVHAGYNDTRTYTYQFTKTFPISRQAVFTDSSSIVVTETADYDSMPAKLSVNDFYNRRNTTVRIENGEIVEISRIFVP